MTTDTIKLFDKNNKLIDTFDEEIEKVLKSVHGEHYYDVDKPIEDTRELKKLKENVKNELVKEQKKVTFYDFLPLLFYVSIFAIVVLAGYYFLNTVDLMSFIK